MSLPFNINTNTLSTLLQNLIYYLKDLKGNKLIYYISLTTTYKITIIIQNKYISTGIYSIPSLLKTINQVPKDNDTQILGIEYQYLVSTYIFDDVLMKMTTYSTHNLPNISNWHENILQHHLYTLHPKILINQLKEYLQNQYSH